MPSSHSESWAVDPERNRAMMKSLLLRHLQTFLRSIGSLCRRPVATTLTLMGIGVALSVPMVLYVLVLNVSQVFDGWHKSPRLSVFLHTVVTDEAAVDFAAGILADQDVAQVELIGREQGLEELLDEANLDELRDHITSNPLPDVIEVYAIGGLAGVEYRLLQQRLSGMNGVSLVQLDLEWIERLQSITQIAIRMVLIFWVLLFFGVALVIANSVRLGMVTARDEIEVISLVGGSAGFVRRPFLYNGVIQAVAGALLAVAILGVVMALLGTSIDRLLAAYGSDLALKYIPPGLVFKVVLASGLIGWLAAFFTANRHLHDMLPR